VSCYQNIVVVRLYIFSNEKLFPQKLLWMMLRRCSIKIRVS